MTKCMSVRSCAISPHYAGARYWMWPVCVNQVIKAFLEFAQDPEACCIFSITWSILKLAGFGGGNSRKVCRIRQHIAERAPEVDRSIIQS